MRAAGARWRAIVPVVAASMSTALLGDMMMYAVLPTRHAAAGIGVGALGTMLSVHRFIRLVANPAAGWLYDRLGRRRPFLLGMTFALAATSGYAVATGFWPLLTARLVWGLAYALLSVGALTVIFDLTTTADRGRAVGLYHALVATGSLVGFAGTGALTDWLGYRTTLAVLVPCTALGVAAAAIGVPDTRAPASPAVPRPRRDGWWGHRPRGLDRRVSALGFAAFATFFTNSGMLMATLGLYLRQAQERHGDVGLFALPVASLTGALLAGRRAASLLGAPAAGWLSDRLGDRRPVAAAGALTGVAGFWVLAGAPGSFTTPLGVGLAALGEAIAAAGLSAWAGDLAPAESRGVLMGVFAAVTDLGGALGPLVGYAVAGAVGFGWMYGGAAGLLAVAAVVLASVPSLPAARGSVSSS